MSIIRKLTMDQARDIRREYVKGSSEFGRYGLAKKYGVSPGTISMILERRTYKEPQNPLDLIGKRLDARQLDTCLRRFNLNQDISFEDLAELEDTLARVLTAVRELQDCGGASSKTDFNIERWHLETRPEYRERLQRFIRNEDEPKGRVKLVEPIPEWSSPPEVVMGSDKIRMNNGDPLDSELNRIWYKLSRLDIGLTALTRRVEKSDNTETSKPSAEIIPLPEGTKHLEVRGSKGESRLVAIRDTDEVAVWFIDLTKDNKSNVVLEDHILPNVPCGGK